MIDFQEGDFFKRHGQNIGLVLFVGVIVLLLGLWLRAWGINRALTFVSINFTHILAHIFIYVLLGSLVLLLAPYLLSRPFIYIAATIPLLLLPRLLQLFTTDSPPWQIIDAVSLLIDLLGVGLAYILFQRLMSKFVVPLFESVSDMTDLAMIQYKAKALEQYHPEVTSLFSNDIIGVADILETLALLATGVSLQSISQVKGFEQDTVLEWLKTAIGYRLIIETYLTSKYKLSQQQLEKLRSLLELE